MIHLIDRVLQSKVRRIFFYVDSEYKIYSLLVTKEEISWGLITDLTYIMLNGFSMHHV